MKKQVFWITIFAFLTLGLFGCDKLFPGAKKEPPKEEAVQPQAPVVTGTVIAKVNSMPITLEDLNQEVDAINSQVTADNRPEDKIDTRDKKLKYLKDAMVQRALLYQYALDQGLDKQPAIQHLLEKSKEAILVQALSEDEANKIDVTSTEIQSYYDQYKEQFKNPEERHISEILVET